jgi:hypothetical protein
MDEIKRDGGIGDAAASNDNKAAMRAHNRIWPLIAASPQFIEEFGEGCVWTYTKWGSDADLKHSTDGHVLTKEGKRILFAGRVQEYVYKNTFTLRTNEQNMEFEKLIDGRDKTEYHLHAYLIKNDKAWLGGEFQIAGWIKTIDLRKFVIQYPNDRWKEKNKKNGIEFWCIHWDNIFSRAKAIGIDTPMRYFQSKKETLQRTEKQDTDHPIVYRCEICGDIGHYGFGVHLRAGQIGRWFCFAHKPIEERVQLDLFK